MATVTSVRYRDIDDRENANEWVKFGLRLAVQSALHPFEYGKVLIQVSLKIFPNVYIFFALILWID
jgi:hypothetical protein